MSNEPNSTATMIIENVKFGSKSSAGKGELKLTYSSREYPELNQFLIEQAGNPVDLTIRSIQGNLQLVTRAASNGATPATKDEPDAEITEMIVNGEPSKVKRPRKSSNGNGAHADTYVPYSYHPFEEGEDTPGLCGFASCHKRADDVAHQLAPWPEGDKPLPHAFRHQGRSNSCGWCHLGIANELHVEGEEVPSFEEEAPSVVESLTDTLLAGLEDDAQPAAEAVAVGEGA